MNTILRFSFFILFSTIQFSYGQAIKHQKIYGGLNYDHGRSLKQTADSGYFVVGNTFSYGAGDYDAFLMKTNKFGKIEWSKQFGGVRYESFNELLITADKGILLAGSSLSFNGARSFYLV